MLIYLETRVKDAPLSQRILRQFPTAEVLEIDHYKNIFDKNIGQQKLTPAFILAKDEHPQLLSPPPNYGYPGKSFFFKTSLNCVFDCEYCYLKGNFKTQYSVFFVNYEDIQARIQEKIQELRAEGYEDQITFYASNYSDIQGMDMISGFNQAFFSFFEKFEGVLMETRTKSAHIASILEAEQGVVPKNIEIAFSLNPDAIIQRYEKGTPPLAMRLEAIESLIAKGYKVGLRFLPLLPVEGYEELYRELLRTLKARLDLSQLHSIFIASLIYNQGDLQTMKKHNPDSPLWSMLELHDNKLWKLPDAIFQQFIEIFESELPGQEFFLDFV